MNQDTFISHLIELRDRMLRGLLAVTIVFVCLFPWAKDLYTMLAQPLLAVLPQGGQMIATDVVGVFLVPLKVTALVAVMITIVAAECLVMNNPMIEKSSSMAQRLRTELVQVERRTTGKKVTIKNILEIVIVEGAHLRLIGTAMGVVTIEVGKEKEGSIMGPAVVGDIQDLIIKI